MHARSHLCCARLVLYVAPSVILIGLGVSQTQAQAPGSAADDAALVDPNAVSLPNAGVLARPVQPLRPGARGQERPSLPATMPGQPAVSQPAFTGPPPSIEAENLVYDFGAVVAGDSVKHTFTLKNVGEGTLSITQVRPQCGCTVASSWAKEVKPGGTWELPVNLRTTGFSGKVRKPITVTTNDPKMPSLRFDLVGEIQARFKIEPRQNVYLVMTDPNALESQTLTITNQIEKLTVFTSAHSSSASFATELREVEKGKVYELVVKTVPPLKEAVTRATIELKTEDKEQTPLIIQAHAAVQPRITAGPNQLHIHTPAPRDTKRLITIRNAGKTPVHVLDVQTSNSELLTSVDSPEGDQGRTIQVWVTVPKDMVLQPEGESVTLIMDDVDFPKFTTKILPYPPARSAATTQSIRPINTAPGGGTP